jgi:hypothetical protein
MLSLLDTSVDMKKLWVSLSFLALTWLTCNYACALDINITVPSALTRSDTLQIQSKLDQIAAANGGTLTLTGPATASVLVVETNGLQVSSNTTLRGDPANPKMVLVGENTPGLNYRAWPLIQVVGATSSAATPATLYNLDIEGGTTGPSRPLGTYAIWIQNSSYVQIVYDTIAGARTFGIAATSTSNLTIQYLSLGITRKALNESTAYNEGGAGIWCGALAGVPGSFGCQNAQVLNSYVHADDYFNSGPPSDTGDPRVGTTPPPTAIPPTDSRGPAKSTVLIEFSDGSNNTFAHNSLYYSNTAAIFLFPGVNGTGENGDVIWDNHIAYCRQAGLDIDKASNLDILTNTMTTYFEGSIIGLANSTCDTAPGKGIQFNTLDKGGNWLLPNQYPNDFGAFQLQGNTHGCTEITNNYIHGSNNPYAVYFFELVNPLREPNGNTVTNNNLWSGTSGYLNGHYTGWNTLNTVSPNTLH